MYAKQIWIILAIIAISSSIYAMSIKSPEERLRDAIILQNQAIEELNSAKLESYLEIKQECEDTASWTSREILEQLTECSKMEKPNIQELLQVPWDSGSGVNAQTADSKNLLNRWTHSTGITVPPERLNNNIDEKKLQECLSKYDKIDNTISNVCMDYAEWVRTSNIDFELETEKLSQLHTKVCEKQINSPLCKDRALFDRLYHITEERLPGKQFFPILLGITNAESSLGLAYSKDNVWGTCYGRNNWWWIKWKINDDWSRQKDQPIPDKYWCYLYQFDSIDSYWISKVNTFRFYYKWCIDHKTPIWCISWPYVGKREVHEQSWIDNTSIFLD